MFGRKKAHFFAILLVAVSGLISAFSTSWQMFASLRLVVGVSTEIIGHLQTNICRRYFEPNSLTILSCYKLVLGETWEKLSQEFLKLVC